VEELVVRIGDQAGDGPDEPFGEIEEMGEGILDGAPALAMVGEVDIAVGGPVEGEVLGDRPVDVDGCAVLARVEGFFHFLKTGMGAEVVADSGEQTFPGDESAEFGEAVEGDGERFLDV